MRNERRDQLKFRVWRMVNIDNIDNIGYCKENLKMHNTRGPSSPFSPLLPFSLLPFPPPLPSLPRPLPSPPST